MTSEEYMVFTARCTRLDASLGLRNTVALSLKRTTGEILRHGRSEQTLVQDNRTTSSLTFDLPLRSQEYIYSVLLQRGVELPICHFAAPRISRAAERFGNGRQGLHMDVNVEIAAVTFLDQEENESENRGGVSEELMKMLKRETRFNGGDLKRDGDCSICLEGLSRARKIIKMPCSHLFHESCIFTWLQTKNACPLCREVPFADRFVFR